jgi:hypothetical protein
MQKAARLPARATGSLRLPAFAVTGAWGCTWHQAGSDYLEFRTPGARFEPQQDLVHSPCAGRHQIACHHVACHRHDAHLPLGRRPWRVPAPRSNQPVLRRWRLRRGNVLASSFPPQTCRDLLCGAVPNRSPASPRSHRLAGRIVDTEHCRSSGKRLSSNVQRHGPRDDNVTSGVDMHHRSRKALHAAITSRFPGPPPQPGRLAPRNRPLADWH